MSRLVGQRTSRNAKTTEVSRVFVAVNSVLAFIMQYLYYFDDPSCNFLSVLCSYFHQVVGIRALEMKGNKAVLDLDLRWAANAEFVVEAGVKPVPLLITLNKIRFSGRLRVELAPLVPVVRRSMSDKIIVWPNSISREKGETRLTYVMSATCIFNLFRVQLIASSNSLPPHGLTWFRTDPCLRLLSAFTILW